MEIILNSFTNERFEIRSEDFQNPMTCEEAKKCCEDLGDGWRLPTSDELYLVYEMVKKNQRSFNTNTEIKTRKKDIWDSFNTFGSFYWSLNLLELSEKLIFDNFEKKCFETGMSLMTINFTAYVRAVRTIK